ncbi:hypothetical protein MMC29_000345 [Sticta canariensis]|nr:hypothetical protein [Sticta canariensis]
MDIAEPKQPRKSYCFSTQPRTIRKLLQPRISTELGLRTFARGAVTLAPRPSATGSGSWPIASTVASGGTSVWRIPRELWPAAARRQHRMNKEGRLAGIGDPSGPEAEASAKNFGKDLDALNRKFRWQGPPPGPPISVSTSLSRHSAGADMRLADPLFGVEPVTHRRHKELNKDDFLYQEDGSGVLSLSGLDSQLNNDDFLYQEDESSDSSLSELDLKSEKTVPRPRKKR